MRRWLEGSLQVDDEGVVDPFENVLLTLHMFNLLKLYYLTFLQAFQSQRKGLCRIISMLNKTNSTKSTSSKSRDKVEIIQIEVTIFLSLSSSNGIFRSVICGCFSIVEDVFRLFLVFWWFFSFYSLLWFFSSEPLFPPPVSFALVISVINYDWRRVGQ